MAAEATTDAAMSRRVLRGAIGNYLERAVWLGTYVFLTPFIVRRLGATDFGLWTLVGSLVSYGALLDFGIQGAVTKYVAEYTATGDDERARKLVATSVCLYSGLGALVIVLSAVAALLFPVLFNVPAQERATARWLVLLTGLAVGLFMPATTALAVLQGLQRYDITNTIGALWALVSVAATVVVLLLGAGVLGMAAVNIPLELAMQAVILWRLKRIAPGLRIGWRGADRSLIRPILGFSSSSFVMQTATQLRTRTDEIVIGAFLPIRAVAPYGVARRLADLPATVSQQALEMLLPVSSTLHAGNEHARLRALYLAGTRLTLAICLPLAATLIVLAPPLLSVWIGPAYAGSAAVLGILAVATTVTMSQAPAVSIMQGMGRHRPIAFLLLGSAIVNVVLSVVLVRRFGVTGIAAGALLHAAVVSFGFVLPYIAKTLGVGIADVLSRILWPVLTPLAPAALALYAARQAMRPDSLVSLAVVAAAGLLVYALVYLTLGASAGERQLYRGFLSGAWRSAAAYAKRS